MKKDKVLTLAALRQHSGNVKQAVIALEMAVQEPAISKLERKRISDASLDKLGRYIKAIGGSLEISVKLPDGTVITQEDLS